MNKLLIAVLLMAMGLQAYGDNKLPFKGKIGMSYAEVEKAEGKPTTASDEHYVYKNLIWRGFQGELDYGFHEGVVDIIWFSVDTNNPARLLQEIQRLYKPITPDDYIRVTIQRSIYLNKDDERGTREEKIDTLKEVVYASDEEGVAKFFTYKKYIIDYDRWESSRMISTNPLKTIPFTSISIAYK